MDPQCVFGPVPSRRLGRSLGINPIPFKTCTYNCSYCQLGRTNRLTVTRDDYLDADELSRQLEQAAALHHDGVDYATFVGEGEPTLCRSLGALMARAQSSLGLPVALITNGSLLCRTEVRREASIADVVMPSLDAVTEAAWRKLNRPHPALSLGSMVDGLRRFRQGFSGQLWLEIMLVASVNDTEAELTALRDELQRLAPDRVYVNVPLRPPAEKWVDIPSAEGLARARAILGDGVFIDAAEEGAFDTAGYADPLEAVMAIVRRHPMRTDQIAAALPQFTAAQLQTVLSNEVERGRLNCLAHHGEEFYATGKARFAAGSRIHGAGS
jgi:wyosine [tRNA(Phe)-imidazoG37] synthetase (radical SAM superfamily)